MKMTRARAIQGIVGGTLAVAAGPRSAGGAAEAEAATVRPILAPISRWEQPRFMAGELLLTFTSVETKNIPSVTSTTLATHDGPIYSTDPRVKTLIGRAAKILQHLGALQQVSPPMHNTPPAPLTLRFSLTNAGKPVGEAQLKRAIDLLNKVIQFPSQYPRALQLQFRGLKVWAAMPDWLITAAPAAWHGGPGSVPRKAPAFKTMKVQPPFAWPTGAHPVAPVTVAVLDTWPQHNPLGPSVTVDAGFPLPQVDPGYQQHPTTTNDEVAPGVRAMADHGLFVAGIINDIAPHAVPIRVMQVLGGDGFGLTSSVLQALDRCLELAHRGLVVVNLSLYMLIPPADQTDGQTAGLRGAWNSPGWTPKPGGQGKEAERADLPMLHYVVQNSATLLRQAGAVVVAAAGNDALAYGAHLQPRLPADYDNVICVVATAATGTGVQLAAYSNFADQPLEGNCFATWGGQGVLDGVNPLDGSTIVLPQKAPAGRSTVAKALSWSGTSFAAPIISGIAANVLATAPTAAGVARQTAVTDALNQHYGPAGGHPIDPTIGCPYVPAMQ